MNRLTNSAPKYVGNSSRRHSSTIPTASLPVQPTLDALFLTPDSVVVELGEDAGRFTLPLARYFAIKAGDGMVYACDFTEDAVERLEQKSKDAHVEKYVRSLRLNGVKPYAMPLPDDHADAILAVNPAEYQAAPDAYIRECLRVLRPGGGMLIASRLDTRTAQRKSRSPFDMPLDAVFSSLKRGGAEICTTIDVSGYSWAVLVVKPLVHIPA